MSREASTSRHETIDAAERIAFFWKRRTETGWVSNSEALWVLGRYKVALERIAQYDMTQMRAGVNTAVIQGIARDALYGDDYVLPGETSL